MCQGEYHMPIRIAFVATKNALKSAERSTNVKLGQLERDNCTVLDVKGSAIPIIDVNNIDKSVNVKLLWMSTITYETDKNIPIPDPPVSVDEALVFKLDD